MHLKILVFSILKATGLFDEYISMSQDGFTLLELLITLFIISILVTIGYPSYHQYVLTTHRVQAEIALLELNSAIERYFALYHTYYGATLTNLEVNPYTEGDYYSLSITNLSDTTYLLQAIPLGNQIYDKDCGTLMIDQYGERSISGKGNVTDCWR